MKRVSALRKIAPAVLLGLVLAVGVGQSAYGGNSETTVETQDGIVVLHNGVVGVGLRSGEVLVPSNGGGLLRAGAISEGDIVTVRVVVHTKDNGKHKHRGHVTILK